MRWMSLAAFAAAIACAAPAGAAVLYTASGQHLSGPQSPSEFNIVNPYPYSTPIYLNTSSFAATITLHGNAFTGVSAVQLGNLDENRVFVDGDPNTVFTDYENEVDVGCGVAGPGTCTNPISGDILQVTADTIYATFNVVPVNYFAQPPDYDIGHFFAGNYYQLYDEIDFGVANYLDLDAYNATTYDVTISSVPEPEAWLALIAGFAMMGMALRARRGNSTWRPKGLRPA